MDFNEELKHRVAEIEQLIKDYLPKEDGWCKTVISAMNYSVMAGGKRIRPMLLLETYRLFQNDLQEESAYVWPFMAAIEMIHTYSLVHDDLPAMDNDEYRRGRKTTHVVFGEAMGILAGDALLNYAFETACKAFSTGCDYQTIANAIQLLAAKPGVYGMIGGQVVDIESSGITISKERLDVIYDLKTGALIECAMGIGAVLGKADKKQRDLIMQIASEIGLAFQIQDDILDVTSTQEELGKPINSDEKNEKTTYVTLYGLEKSKEMVEEISAMALSHFKELGRKNEFLEALIRYLIKRKY